MRFRRVFLILLEAEDVGGAAGCNVNFKLATGWAIISSSGQMRKR